MSQILPFKKALSQDFIKGYELEFTSDDLIAEFDNLTSDQQELTSSPQNRAARKAFVEALEKTCSGCRIVKDVDKYKVVQYRVVYKDGFSYRVTVDPGVLEIVLDKNAGSSFQKNIEIIQRDIYQVIKDIGLRVEVEGPSMHVSIDVDTTFKGDLLFFHNYIVDTLNHKNIWSRILGRHDHENAAFVDDLSVGQQKAYAKVIADFEAGLITSIDQYARRMLYGVFHTSNWKGALHPEDKHEKFMILNLLDFMKTSTAPKRVEFRGLKTMDNAKEFALVDQLIDARLRYLSQLKKPLQYNPGKAGPIVAYHQWLSQMNLGWRKYQALVPKDLQGALKVFNQLNALPIGFQCDRLLKTVGG